MQNIPKPNYVDTFFPSHLLDPAQKNQDWCLQYAKAAYQTWSNNYLWLQRRADWISDRKYAEGNQTNQKYIDWMTRVKDELGKKASYLNLDWSIISTIPKIRRVVINHLLKINYDIIATAVNPEAVDAKETVKLRTWAEKSLQPFLAQMEEKSGVPLTNPELDIIPEVKEEFEMLFAMTYKMAEEMKIELATQHILDKNRFEETRRKMIEDAFDLGFCACKVDTNSQTNEIDVRYCDPINLMYDNYRGKTGSIGDGDIERIGEFRALTVAQLRQEAGNQFNDDEYKEMARAFSSYYNNPFVPINQNQPFVNTDTNFNQWQNFQLIVVDLYWLSTDRHKIKRVKVDDEEMVYTKGANANLGATTDYKDGKKVEKSIEAVDIQTIYKCSWILNTEFCYNWGKAYDIPRDHLNPRECSLPIKIYRSDNKSILEGIIPYADALQLTWLRLQNLKTMALPKGLMIDIGAWDNVMVDGKIKSTQELFQMATETGIVLYRGQSTLDSEGVTRTGRPIEELDGGLGKQFTELVADMDYSTRMIYEVSGINEIMAAGNPDPNLLSGVMKQAVLSSENSLGSIMAAVTSNHERCGTDISLKLQTMLQNGSIRVYNKALGKIIEVGSEVSPMSYGIALEPRPTDKQREEMKQMIMSSVINPNNPQTGGLYIDDAIPLINELESGTNVKLIMRKYSYMLQKRRKDFAAMEQQKIQTQSDGIVQQTQAATQGQTQILQMQHQFKLEEIAAQAQADIQVEQVKAKMHTDQTVVKSELNKGEEAFKTTLPQIQRR